MSRRDPLNFCHLAVRSDHSRGSSVGRVTDLVAAAKLVGQKSLALTDAGTLSGMPEFVRECRAAGIEPLLGLELPVRKSGTSRERKASKREQDDLFSKGGPAEANDDLFGVGLIAESTAGWKNLVALASSIDAGRTDPLAMSVTIEDLAEHSEGLIVRVRVPGHVDGTAAVEFLSQFSESFSEGSVFHELSPDNLTGPSGRLSTLMDAAEQVGMDTVITNRVRYPKQADTMVLAAMKAWQSNEVVPDVEWWTSVSGWVCDATYFTPSVFPGLTSSQISEAVSAVAGIAERAHGVAVEAFPKRSADRMIRLPDEEPQMTFREHVDAGVESRWGLNPSAHIQVRVANELAEIEAQNIEALIMTARSVVIASDRMEFFRGTGRGSVAGSAIAYALGITDVDPIEHRLPFERFLSAGRHGLPDIDIDVEAEARDHLIFHLTELLGPERVAFIPVFHRLTKKMAWQAAARVLDISPVEAIKAFEQLAGHVGSSRALRSLNENERLMIAEVGVPENLLLIATGFEGVIHSDQVNPAGLALLNDRSLEDIPANPNFRHGLASKPMKRLAYDSGEVDWLSIPKLDLLSSLHLKFMRSTLRTVKTNHGIEIDVANIELDDKATFKLLAKGDSSGVFQLESDRAQNLLNRSKVATFKDLCALTAVNRPGPRKAGTDRMWAEHCAEDKVWDGWPRPLRDVIQPILSDSRGLVIYEEQFIDIANAIAGHTPAKADALRRSLKSDQAVAEHRNDFIAGAVRNGYSGGEADRLFTEMASSAGYLLSKCHAVAYTKMSFQAAWLRAHHPSEFFVSQLGRLSSHNQRAMETFSAARRSGLAFLGPSVNGPAYMTAKGSGQNVSSESIVFGYGEIAGVSDSERNLIQRRQTEAKFLSLTDFLVRVGLGMSARSLEALADAGAFDELNAGSRKALAAAAPKLRRAVEQAFRQADNEVGNDVPSGLFAAPTDTQEPVQSNRLGPRSTIAAACLDIRPIIGGPNGVEYSRGELAAAEFERLGHSISFSPFELVRTSLRESRSRQLHPIEEVQVVGFVTSVEAKPVRSGRNTGKVWAKVKLVTDREQRVEAKFPAAVWQRMKRNPVRVGDVIEVVGRPADDHEPTSDFSDLSLFSLWVRKSSTLIPDEDRDDCPTFAQFGIEQIQNVIHQSPRWTVFTYQGATTDLSADVVIKALVVEMLESKVSWLPVYKEDDFLLILTPGNATFYDQVIDTRSELVNLGELRLEKRQARAVRLEA